MASSLAFLDRQMTVAMAGLDDAAMRKQLAMFAKQSVAEVIGSGRAPAQYERVVNGRVGATEESVQLPGPIVYRFNNFAVAVRFALAELQRRAPRRSGRYATSFEVLVNQRPTADFSNIPDDAEVIIVNRQPYTRKLETADAGWRAARYFNPVKNTLNSRFRDVFQVQVVFLNMPAGILPGVPYILKRSSGRQKSSAAGQPITYPALVISSA